MSGFALKNKFARNVAVISWLVLLIFLSAIWLNELEPIRREIVAFVTANSNPAYGDWLGSLLSRPAFSLSAAVVALSLIVAANLVWRRNEKHRDWIARRQEPQLKKAGFPEGFYAREAAPDLRQFPYYTLLAIVAALAIVPLTPLLLASANAVSCSSAVGCMFDEPTGRFVPWVSFAFDTIFRAAIFFDFPEVYAWQPPSEVTQIQPIASSLKMAIRIALDVLLIATVVSIYQRNRTVREAMVRLDEDGGDVDVARLGTRALKPLLRRLRNAKLASRDVRGQNNIARALGMVGTLSISDELIRTANRAEINDVTRRMAVRSLGGVIKHQNKFFAEEVVRGYWVTRLVRRLRAKRYRSRMESILAWATGLLQGESVTAKLAEELRNLEVISQQAIDICNRAVAKWPADIPEDLRAQVS